MNQKPRIGFLVNGSQQSAMAERAFSFASRLKDFFSIEVFTRNQSKLSSTFSMVRSLMRFGPSVCYVFDMSSSGVLAAWLYKRMAGTPFIIDTGDAIVPLAEALGRTGFSLYATKELERLSLRNSSAVVVRGSKHRDLLVDRGVHSTVIPDGVDVAVFEAAGKSARRKTSQITLGVLGSITWSPRNKTCYGCELVETISRLKQRYFPRQVRGIVIGDGDGLQTLKRLSSDLDVADLIEFHGRVPYRELPVRLADFDIAISTQTNDIVGNVRTTGKLPLYLASGRYVLATRVGEAALVLPDGMLVEYEGQSDLKYAEKLADRVEQLIHAEIDFSFVPESAAIARRCFDYDQLAPRVGDILRQLV
jgi:glycosyltransferase involved in cell wall biosynthesis